MARDARRDLDPDDIALRQQRLGAKKLGDVSLSTAADLRERDLSRCLANSLLEGRVSHLVGIC